MAFLTSREPRPLTAGGPSTFRPSGLYLGAGAMGLEIAVYESPRRPARVDLVTLHSDRLGRRATPVIVVVLWGEGRAAVCGPAGADVAVALDADASQIERICDAAPLRPSLPRPAPDPA